MDEDVAHALELARQDKERWAEFRRWRRRTRQRSEKQAEAEDVPMAPHWRSLVSGEAGHPEWSDGHGIVYRLMQVWYRHGRAEPTSTPTGPFIRFVLKHAPEAGTPRSLQRVVTKVKERVKLELELEAGFGQWPPKDTFFSVKVVDPYPRKRAPYRRKQA
jgi:hypothetical protein